MSSEMILKLPCIVVGILAIDKSLTPPGVSAKNERTPYAGVLAALLQFGIDSLGFIKTIYWTVALAEIVAIVAKESTSNISTYIQSALSVNGRLGDIRFTPQFGIGILCISLGTLIRVSCFRAMNKLFTFEATITKTHRLVTSGPYSVVRHPSYAGLLIMDVGIICWFCSSGSFLRESGVLATMAGKIFFGYFAAWMLAVLVALLQRARVEDAALREKFGSEWEEWARRVPYAFLPGVV